jgi:hypothetical protein
VRFNVGTGEAYSVKAEQSRRASTSSRRQYAYIQDQWRKTSIADAEEGNHRVFRGTSQPTNQSITAGVETRRISDGGKIFFNGMSMDDLNHNLPALTPHIRVI